MKIDDLVEIVNNFEACRYMIETLMEPITTAYIRKLHRMLFYGSRLLTICSVMFWSGVIEMKLRELREQKGVT